VVQAPPKEKHKVSDNYEGEIIGGLIFMSVTTAAGVLVYKFWQTKKMT